MAAPAYVGAGTGTLITGTSGTVSKTGCTLGNLLVIVALADGGIDETPSMSNSVTNITSLAGVAGSLTSFSSGGSFQLGGNLGRVAVRFGRVTADGTCSHAPSITTRDMMCRIYEFSGVLSSGTTAETIAENSGMGMPNQATSTTTTVNGAEVVSTDIDRLGVNLVSISESVTIGPFTGNSGGTWAEAVAEYQESGGTAATLQLQTVAMPTAGSVTGGTVTIGTTSGSSALGFALIPNASSEKQSFYAYRRRSSR